MNKVIDFHGYTVEEAINKTHTIIGEIRLNNISKSSKQPQEIKFITGQGLIHKEILVILKSYNIEFSVPIYNQGQINALIE